MPRLPRFNPGLHTLGPLALLASLAVSWPAFAGATGDGGNVAFGLYIGAVSIILMAWSFLLAVRIPFLEPFFGGLDRMYQVHRWAGTFAAITMFLHTSIEPEIDGGIRGASESLADTAEELAGTGEVMIYGLIALSLLRWFPYRWWRLTHKLFGIPFAFACFHFFTAEKTYANDSAWGIWFGAIMVIGLVTYVWRVFKRDMVTPGLRYKVTESTVRGSTLEIAMEPTRKALDYRAGQFAVLKVQEPGLREPHVFTIASSPSDGELRFFIRDLGDWTGEMLARGEDLLGSTVIVEGPYGRFEPLGHNATRTVWVAGGVGITPFLSAMIDLDPMEDPVHRPTLFYAVRSADDAMAIEVLRRAEYELRLNLVICSSADGRRFTPELMEQVVGSDLRGAQVAVCGPAGLVATVDRTARRLGASDVEHEDFDIRQGFGPDLSRDVHSVVRSVTDRG